MVFLDPVVELKISILRKKKNDGKIRFERPENKRIVLSRIKVDKTTKRVCFYRVKKKKKNFMRKRDACNYYYLDEQSN